MSRNYTDPLTVGRGLNSHGRSLTERRGPAVTNVCELRMIHQKGMENMFSSSTFIIHRSALVWIWSTALMRSHFNLVKGMKFRSPAVYITVRTHTFFVIFWFPALLESRTGPQHFPDTLCHHVESVSTWTNCQRVGRQKRRGCGRWCLRPALT